MYGRVYIYIYIHIYIYIYILIGSVVSYNYIMWVARTGTRNCIKNIIIFKTYYYNIIILIKSTEYVYEPPEYLYTFQPRSNEGPTVVL